MAKVGDRIRLSTGKGANREGRVVAVTGAMVRVRWASDEESTVVPAPGTLTVLPPMKAASKTSKKKAPAAKQATPAAKKAPVAAKAAAPKKGGVGKKATVKKATAGKAARRARG